MPVEMTQLLDEAIYPCSADELADYAREQGADDEIVTSLQRLGSNRFSSPDEVRDAFLKFT